MLPRVLCGSSVGSIVAGITATRTDEELRETFDKIQEVGGGGGGQWGAVGSRGPRAWGRRLWRSSKRDGAPPAGACVPRGRPIPDSGPR
jgi:predicted acylesterase/phospholipase RssA